MEEAKKLEVGQDIEAYCKKCKTNKTHTIAAIEKRSARKVVCQACNDEHIYVKPKNPADAATKKKKAASKSSTRRSSKKTIEDEWNELVTSLESSKALDYNMSSDYSENCLIKHPTFGLGVVTKRVNSYRAEILFENEIKLMAINRK
jgi:hypothetical protein